MGSTATAAFEAISQAIDENKEYLTALDAAIGDADHGINMARGFQAVTEKIRGLPEDADLGVLLKTVGMTLISTVGGAAGPLYGTAFLRAAGIAQGRTILGGDTAAQMLAAAGNGVKERGKATVGEKTMLDALVPACEAFAAATEAGKTVLQALEEACAAADGGVEHTKTIIATKGRASYLGERSLGHQDPGATSSALMLKALAGFLHRRQLGR